jgi:hypothetical protein
MCSRGLGSEAGYLNLNLNLNLFSIHFFYTQSVLSQSTTRGGVVLRYCFIDAGRLGAPDPSDTASSSCRSAVVWFDAKSARKALLGGNVVSEVSSTWRPEM